MKTRLTQLLGIEHPIIQGGMIWCSGWELAAAVSNAGGLGTLGSGSMYPDELRAQLASLRAATDRPFAVNLPMLYPNIAAHLQSCIDFDVPVVITSAGNPKLHTAWLKERGRTVLHVVASSAFAVKAEAAGVDAVIAEGFEAGGHNGRDETTTMVLVPAVVDAVSIPVVAAGGISDGRSMAAALMLGAEGVQMGSRFVATPEASAHEAFKREVLQAGEGDTQLTLKELAPVRLLKNPFYAEVAAAYARGAQPEELAALLGRGRAKKGMREGDLVEGELEIGQVAARISELMPAADVVRETVQACEALLRRGR
ncbi:MAG: NAD(P)H-dependent flavin oxidoreductase [Schleiferiaceae bacterium]|jgi:enoyl-[acyl-carrier protein] reductase II